MSEEFTPAPESEKRKSFLNPLKEKIHNYMNPPEGPVNPERRAFLKNLGKAAVAAPVVSSNLANGLADFSEGVDRRRTLENKEMSSQPIITEFVDFTYGDPKPLIHQALGNEDRSEEIGVGTEEYKAHESSFILSDDEAVVKTAILNQILQEKKGHGELTTGTFVNTAKENGLQVEAPHISPLEGALVSAFEHDELGNVIAKVSVDTDKLAAVIAQMPPDLSIVNMSLIVGESQEKYVFRKPKDLDKFEYMDPNNVDAFFYTLQEPSTLSNINGNLVPVDSDGAPLEIVSEDEYNNRNKTYHDASIKEYAETGQSQGIVNITSSIQGEENNPSFVRERTEAYNERLAPENLPKLVDLAKQFPNKTFFCAGGNEDDNFYWSRKDIEEKTGWPENLLLIGVKHDIYKQSEVETDGCDIYLDTKDFDWLNDGGYLSASEATAVVSSIANSLDNKLKNTIVDSGERARQIRTTLLTSASETSTYQTKGVSGKDEDEFVSRDCKVLRPDLYKNILTSV
jgi:hypothetical protein